MEVATKPMLYSLMHNLSLHAIIVKMYSQNLQEANARLQKEVLLKLNIDSAFNFISFVIYFFV